MSNAFQIIFTEMLKCRHIVLGKGYELGVTITLLGLDLVTEMVHNCAGLTIKSICFFLSL